MPILTIFGGMPFKSTSTALLQSLPPKAWGLLLDPDKFHFDELFIRLTIADELGCSVILIGTSSTIHSEAGAQLLQLVRSHTAIPVVQFPGPDNALLPGTDALLFLSLISGRNPEFLIGHQIKTAKQVVKLNTEIIPTGYILMDGGHTTTAHRVSATSPLASTDSNLAAKTALAGALLGMKLMYLDSGSGASIPVQEQVIKAVKAEVDVPVWVGGGLRNSLDIKKAWEAGADLIIIGNLGEENPELLRQTLAHALG